jgi:hypothetical protein
VCGSPYGALAQARAEADLGLGILLVQSYLSKKGKSFGNFKIRKKSLSAT